MRSFLMIAVVTGLLGWGSEGRAEGQCSACLRYMEEGEVPVVAIDQMDQSARAFCAACAARSELCFLCVLPTSADRRALSDGRLYCARDAAVAVFDGEEVRRICRETLTRMQRVLARHLTLPTQRIDWIVEDVAQRTRGQAEGPARCNHPALRYMLRPDPQGGRRYVIAVLNGVPESRIAAAAAHGVAHAWLTENVPAGRRLVTGTVEGFCDFLARRCMEQAGGATGEGWAGGSDPADGQREAFEESESIYGLYRILEWMQFGSEDRLVAGDTDRVRRLDERLKPERREVRQVIPPSPAPARGPEELVLRSILGTGARRLALVNDVSLAIGEEGRAHVGTNVVRLRCLEIREDSVVLEVEGVADPQELRLRPAAGER